MSKNRWVYDFEEIFTQDPDDPEAMMFTIPEEFLGAFPIGSTVDIRCDDNNVLTITKLDDNQLHVSAKG
tara:strand:- start:56 stop:262 length:207 start_codon:yes stop_codon:yes gene_type:complete